MKKVILDVDTGIDDALAIAYAINSHKLDVVGITTSFGNVSVKEATRNTLQVLEIMNKTEIPVSMGEEKPMARGHLKGKATHVHGENGLGNVDLPLPMSKPIHTHAVDFMIEKSLEFSNELTVIAVGALTNLALAIKKDPTLVERVEKVVVMGGAVTVPGNVVPHAEANIYTDPEAADFVFQSGVPLTLVGLDVTLQTLLTKDDVKKWTELNTPFTNFLGDICQFYMDFYMNENGLEGYGLHDPLAVGAVIDPSFLTTKSMPIYVDLSNDLIGKTVEDQEPNSNRPNIDVCLEVNAEKFKEHFINTLCL
ncbi:nucleoside hydrolase [Evansella tamaricis]|uniref:Nucleoside hydrolase n=1 Tax=Evansella tamaricis TaxID=2069301 RepID=A0ABS6JGL6_9BACI|nr:nucleoside hydrolase [Evansella tamaricis]MBU9712819.1 nucleoside hydrolase [Evansella tamaricis]